MRRTVTIARVAVLLAATGCGSRAPLVSDAAAGPGAAGVSGPFDAKMDLGGAAGTFGSGVAGVNGAAGSALDAGGSDAAAPAEAGQPRPTVAMYPSGQCFTGAAVKNGACVCAPHIPDICPELCVDLSNDANNCGDCGSRCPATSVCQKGVCGPEPYRYFFSLSPPCVDFDYAITGGEIIWTLKGNGAVLTTINKGPGFQRLLAGPEDAPGMVTVSENGTPTGPVVYWVNANTRTIRRTDARSMVGVQPGVTVATSPGAIAAIAPSPDGKSVYFSTGMNVMRVPADGSAPPEAIVLDGGHPGALAFDGDQLYFTSKDSFSIFVVSPLPGTTAPCGGPLGNSVPPLGECGRAVPFVFNLDAKLLVARPGHVVWVDSPTVKATLTQKEFGVQGIGSVQDGVISGLAAAGDKVYFAESADDRVGVIYEATLDGAQAPRPIARGQNRPRSLVADDQYVYWATADCSVTRLRR